MVGKICQDYSDLTAAETLCKFFEIYAESGWREPVQLSLKKYQSAKNTGLRLGVLQAVDQYSNDVMVVLTPND